MILGDSVYGRINKECRDDSFYKIDRAVSRHTQVAVWEGALFETFGYDVNRQIVEGESLNEVKFRRSNKA